MRGLLSLVMVAASLTAATAWSLGRRCADSATMAVKGKFNRGGNDMSRRSLLERLSVSSVLPAVVAVAATSSPEAAVAKGGPASEAELKRMKVGYDGLNYLLDKENFEKITTKCNPECNRNPDAIREYLGLRSMEHPLYKIEKVMEKAQDNIEDVDLLEDYIAAIENWQNAVSNSNSLSYTSSFGEYNPGGGKDAVEKYLLLSRDEAVTARDSLKKIISILNI